MADYRTLTYEHVAHFFRVHPRTVKRWVAQGKIIAPVDVAPGVVRWDEQEFFSWWDKKKEEGKRKYQPEISLDIIRKHRKKIA